MKKVITIICVAIMFVSITFLSSCNLIKENETHIDMNERLISISSENSSFEVLAEQISPAIVGISSIDSSGENVGSGVCVASGGYVITNAHVIANPNNITLYLFNGKTISATQIFSDASLDISILKASQNLPYLPLGTTDNLMVGQDVLAVGTPISLLLKHSFTRGIISALNRTLKVSSSNGDVYMQNLIQHDASLNPGNSGGPLVNSKGEVVGINTLKITSGEGIGFAIPTKSFMSLLNSYVKIDSYETPYIGLFGYDAEIANYYQYTTLKSGVFVVDIANGSPLETIGVKSGDVITKLNDVNITNILDLRNELFKYEKGSTVQITYIHDGKTYVGDVTLEKHPVNNISNNIDLMNQRNVA